MNSISKQSIIKSKGEKMKTIKCEKCGKPLTTYGCTNSGCPEYYDIREVPMEFITAMIEEHGIHHKLKRDPNLYISQADDGEWVVCDNTSYDCFIESFKSKDKAIRYLMGEDPEILYEEEEREAHDINTK